MSLHHAFDRGLTNRPCTLRSCTRLHVHVFTDEELRERDRRVIRAFLAVAYPHDNGFVDDVLYEAIIQLIEQRRAPP